MDFKQWDFVNIQADKCRVDGLITSKDLFTIVWKDGMITRANLLKHVKRGNKFDLYEALLNAKNLRHEPGYILDNLTYIEICDRLKEYEQSI